MAPEYAPRNPSILATPYDAAPVSTRPSRRLAYGLTAALIVVVWLTAAVHAWRSYQNEISHAKTDTALLVTALSAHSQRNLETVDKLLLDLAKEAQSLGVFQGIRKGEDQLRERLRQHADNHDFLLWLNVIAADGTPVVSTLEQGENMLPADWSYVTDSLRTPSADMQVGRTFRSRTCGALLFPVSRVVTDSGGTPLGVIAGYIDSRHFADVHAAVNAELNAVLTLSKVDGAVVAHDPDHGLFAGTTSLVVPDDLQMDLAAGGGLAYRSMPFEGMDRMVAVKTIEGTPLMLAVGLPLEYVVAPLLSALPIYVMIALFVSFSLIAGAWAAVRLQSEYLRVAQAELALEFAESANRSKTQFMADMSHELRTPLNAIIGFAEAMATGALGGNDERARHEYAQTIAQSGHHLLGIINDILDVSAIEVGRLQLHHQPFLFADAAQSAVTFVSSRAAEQGVQMRLDESLSRAPMLYADPQRVKQILVNLLMNAVKFSQDGDTVTVDAQQHAEGWFEFSVSDTGVGMTRAEVARAMKRFEQVKMGLSRRREGSGLGLPLSQSLAELHGGSMIVHSVPGEGTRVTVTLPPACVLPDETT